MDSKQSLKADKISKNIPGEIWVIDFTPDSAQEFRKQVLFESALNPQKPIVIYIDSYGGYVDSLAKMIETMDEVPNPFVTVCMGKAMSCGAMLLSHGNYRYCGRHSRVMVHEVSSGTEGDVHDMHNDAIESKRLNEYFMGILAKNCGISGGYATLRKMIKDKDGRDMYLNAQEAVKFGIVDEIGIPKLLELNFHEVLTLPIKPRSAAVTKEKAKKKKKSSKKPIRK